MEGKSNFWRSLGPEWKHHMHHQIHFVAVQTRLDRSPLPYLRHAKDSGVEIQGFNGVFDPQHGLLHHKILKHTTKIQATNNSNVNYNKEDEQHCVWNTIFQSVEWHIMANDVPVSVMICVANTFNWEKLLNLHLSSLNSSTGRVQYPGTDSRKSISLFCSGLHVYVYIAQTVDHFNSVF